jgi:hypothetical protein
MDNNDSFLDSIVESLEEPINILMLKDKLDYSAEEFGRKLAQAAFISALNDKEVK